MRVYAEGEYTRENAYNACLDELTFNERQSLRTGQGMSTRRRKSEVKLRVHSGFLKVKAIARRDQRSENHGELSGIEIQ